MKINVAVEKEIDLITTATRSKRMSSKQYIDLRNWIDAGQKEIAKAWLVNFIEREYRKETHLRNALFLDDIDTK